MRYVSKHVPVLEQATCATINGCEPFDQGTAKSALRHHEFRTVWIGTFISSIGTWMQNVLIGAFALGLTHQPWFVGLIYFANIGPMLFLAPIGGFLSDILDRRKFLVCCQLEQGVFAAAIAVLVFAGNPNRWAVLFCTLMVGIGYGLNSPGIASLLPTLVPREDLHGAVALQAVQMNLSRVIGPVIGALLLPAFGFGTLFAINAVSYPVAIVSLVIAKYPGHVARRSSDSGLHQLLSGFKIAAGDPLIRRVLTTMGTFSFFSLAFVGLMPAIANDNLTVAPDSTVYGFLYATFGLGCVVGSLLIGNILADKWLVKIVRLSFVGFAVMLAAFALTRQIELAFPAVFMLGCAYFLTVTSLSVSLQSHLDDAIRGRISGLWMMSFNGTVALGVLASGVILLFIHTTTLLLIGSLVAALLAVYCNLSAVRSKV